VRGLIKEKGITKVVDLGCGDFTVGSRLLMNGIRYTGVDIVAALIQRNLQEFSNENVSFQCLDITSDPLPDGELCLLRQVLQHLSNVQITKVLTKIDKYRYVLITEHYPAPTVHGVPNKDKPHGADIRVYDDSAVYLNLPPFNMTISRLVLEVEAGVGLANPGEVIRTFLIENQV
jgi:SAM-dependent methyltransferase